MEKNIKNDNEESTIIKTNVLLVGAKRWSFENKERELVEGSKLFYVTPVVKNDKNRLDVAGYHIDPKNCYCSIAIERYNEFTYQDFPYVAQIEQRFIATDKPLEFIDIKLI